MATSLADPAASAAILIGGSTYRDARFPPLPSVANNVADLRAVLTDTTMWGLPEERCRALLDRTDPSELLEALDQLARAALDTLIVYYAGHGTVTRDGDLVLPTWSTIPDLPKYTALPYSHIRDIVASSRAERRIVVLDCCFSGRALRAMAEEATTIAGQLDAEGTFIMTSAPATSVSLAPEGARNTAFTGELLGILRNGVPSLGELLCLDDLYDLALTAMVRHGWPRPQRLGTNTVGRFRFLYNRAWLRRLLPGPAADQREPGQREPDQREPDQREPDQREPDQPEPDQPEPDQPDKHAGADKPPSLTRYRHVAAGVRAAVGVITPLLGSPDRDSLTELDRALADSLPPASSAASSPGSPPSSSPVSPPELEQIGVALVRETMHAMRAQYGDGATTAAVILGTLVDGLWSLLSDGADPGDLDREMTASAASLTARLTPDSGTTVAPDTAGLRMAIREAIGAHEAVESVMAAVAAVGARNVEVALAGTDEAESTRGTFTLDTTVLAPNSAAGPISLENPLIVVSPDGELDIRALVAAGREARSALLIIAPKVSIHAARSLLHVFSRMVVVRPATPGVDLAALRDRISPPGGSGWCQARRALVLTTSTTIERPPNDLDLSRNRLTVTVGSTESLAIATRALAIARSVTDSGLVAGAGAALFAAARSGGTPASAADALVVAAACAPYQLLRSASRAAGPGKGSAAPATDPLATARGALMHATASAGRYLAGAAA